MSTTLDTTTLTIDRITVTTPPAQRGENDAHGTVTITIGGTTHTRRWNLPSDDYEWGDTELLPDTDDPLVYFASLTELTDPVDDDGYIEARVGHGTLTPIDGALVLPDDTYLRITIAVRHHVEQIYHRALAAADDAYIATWTAAA